MATVGKVDSLTLTIIALTVGADLTATPTVPFTYSYSPPPVKLNGCLVHSALASPSPWSHGKAVYGVGLCKG
jgi:hypothetical protein